MSKDKHKINVTMSIEKGSKDFVCIATIDGERFGTLVKHPVSDTQKLRAVDTLFAWMANMGFVFDKYEAKPPKLAVVKGGVDDWDLDESKANKACDDDVCESCQ